MFVQGIEMTWSNLESGRFSSTSTGRVHDSFVHVFCSFVIFVRSSFRSDSALLSEHSEILGHASVLIPNHKSAVECTNYADKGTTLF